MTEEEIGVLRKRVRAVARQYRLPPQWFDDLEQDVLLRRLENPSVKIDFAVIDYVRREWGDPRKSTHSAHYSLGQCIPLRRTSTSKPALSLDESLDLLQLLGTLEGEDFLIVTSYFFEQYTLLELGRFLKVSESRISQRVSEIVTSLNRQALR